MWKFRSSSFSNSMGTIVKFFNEPGLGSSSKSFFARSSSSAGAIRKESEKEAKKRRRRRKRTCGGIVLFVVGGLDFDALLGNKVGDNHVGDDFFDETNVRGGVLEAIVEGTEIGSKEDKVEVERVFGVEVKDFGSSLGCGPERSASVGDHVEREVEQELLDVVVEVFFPFHASPSNAVFEGLRSFRHQVRFDAAQHVQLLSRRLFVQSLKPKERKVRREE
jgi:hypothetical protein